MASNNNGPGNIWILITTLIEKIGVDDTIKLIVFLVAAYLIAKSHARFTIPVLLGSPAGLIVFYFIARHFNNKYHKDLNSSGKKEEG